MNNTQRISTALDRPGLLENMVEKLAGRHPDYGITELTMPRGLEANDTSSTEAYVSGNIRSINAKQRIKN